MQQPPRSSTATSVQVQANSSKFRASESNGPRKEHFKSKVLAKSSGEKPQELQRTPAIPLHLLQIQCIPLLPKLPSPPPAIAPERTTSPALHSVRVGHSNGATHVHATVDEGIHRGVELRASERQGKIHVELLAPNAQAQHELQQSIDALRAHLHAHGLDRVTVEVSTPPSRDERNRDGEQQQQQREQQSPEEPAEEQSFIV